MWTRWVGPAHAAGDALAGSPECPPSLCLLAGSPEHRPSPFQSQLWHKVQPAKVAEWLNKTDQLSIMDKIEVLQAVAFHTHVTSEDGAEPRGSRLHACLTYL